MSGVWMKVIVTIGAAGTLRTYDFEPAKVFIDDVSQNEGDEGTTSFNFTVSISQILPALAGVSFNTVDGTATTLDGDYQTAVGSLIFQPGEASQTITVQVNGDTTVEPDETFFLNLLPMGNTVLIWDQAQGTILNDDVAPLTNTISAAFITSEKLSSGESFDQSVQAGFLEGRHPPKLQVGEEEKAPGQPSWQAAVNTFFSQIKGNQTRYQLDSYFQMLARKEETEPDFNFLWGDITDEDFPRWFPFRKN